MTGVPIRGGNFEHRRQEGTRRREQRLRGAAANRAVTRMGSHHEKLEEAEDFYESELENQDALYEEEDF